MEEYEKNRQRSSEVFRRARKVMPSGVAGDRHYAQPFPVYYQRGAGSRKWDSDGNEYVDYGLGASSLILGHCHPAVVEAIREQAGRGIFFAQGTELEVEWAELVTQLIPSAEKVRFTSSGSEANMMAIRIARAYTGKQKVICFEGHYHGWHDYTSKGTEYPYDVPNSIGVPREVADLQLVLPLNIEAFEEVLDLDNDVAAVILEPSGAAWGTVPLEPEVIRKVLDVAQRHDVVTIFDEVFSGFRWSPGGVQALHGITPDITTLSKILTGGIPGSAVVGKNEIMRVMEQTGDPYHDRFERVHHGGTFNGYPLAAASGIATLKIVATGEPHKQANNIAAALRAGFQAIIEERGIQACAYGDVSVFHVYFGASSVDGLAAGTIKDMPAELARACRREMQRHGVDLMTRCAGVTSSAHTDADVEQTLKAFGFTVDALLTQGLLKT